MSNDTMSNDTMSNDTMSNDTMSNDTMSDPIELHFDRLEQSGPYAQALARSGYRMAGRWTLAQAADHCASWIHFAIDGNYPPPPPPMRPVFWVISRTVGPVMLRRMIQADSMADGAPTVPSTVPPSDGEPHVERDAAAADRLFDAVNRLAGHDGPITRSPLFGPMDADTARHLHRIHTAHHLKFLVPKR